MMLDSFTSPILQNCRSNKTGGLQVKNAHPKPVRAMPTAETRTNAQQFAQRNFRVVALLSI
jgi:hypothetical protein